VLLDRARGAGGVALHWAAFSSVVDITMRHYPELYATRQALWRAYDMKCFYCGGPVDFRSLNIDHVLPQSLAEDPNQLEDVLRDYEIADVNVRA